MSLAIEPFVAEMEQEAEGAAAESDDALFVQAVVDLALEEVESKQVIGKKDPIPAGLFGCDAVLYELLSIPGDHPIREYDAVFEVL